MCVCLCAIRFHRLCSSACAYCFIFVVTFIHLFFATNRNRLQWNPNRGETNETNARFARSENNNSAMWMRVNTPLVLLRIQNGHLFVCQFAVVCLRSNTLLKGLWNFLVRFKSKNVLLKIETRLTANARATHTRCWSGKCSGGCSCICLHLSVCVYVCLADWFYFCGRHCFHWCCRHSRRCCCLCCCCSWFLLYYTNNIKFSAVFTVVCSLLLFRILLSFWPTFRLRALSFFCSPFQHLCVTLIFGKRVYFFRANHIGIELNIDIVISTKWNYVCVYIEI